MFDGNLNLIERRRYQNGSTSIVFELNHRRYEMREQEMDCCLRKYGLTVYNIQLPWKDIDNRPLWKKDMDMRMGKRVNFNNSPTYPNMNANYFEQELETIKDDLEK